MFTTRGPAFHELAVQALSSVERGYDLLAPKFDHTPFRTPDAVLAAVRDALTPLGPFRRGLDLCCGTGAGLGVLTGLCQERVTGVDFSSGMLRVAGAAHRAVPGGPALDLVRADARALPFLDAFDLVVSFGAAGHFLPAERPALFAGVRAALRPGGLLAFPVAAPPRVGSAPYWALAGFDAAMRLRNALWRPPFVMYYRTFPLPRVRAELAAAGFSVGTVPLTALGTLPDGSPRCRLVLARRPGGKPAS
ncbi:class I SAM-dependent methyltransferase [Streptomyces marincola]|uniref:class I SAM-dependent methyltransferase n=1 Tax=Streptomyces marincola TaxID=2878388 RepID=UPI001CF1BEB7|nr:class I SAM-dependent methyltransferase [Streptomyces marincola]UCM91416.1 class I SAM-dependent methyltransferase [Streptomyces marincola]